MKISELSEDQKSHLAWRLEHNTYCGYGTSCRIARGEFGDMELEEAFRKADKSPRSAKILAKKVMEFTVDPDVKYVLHTAFPLAQRVVAEIRNSSEGESAKRQIMLFREVVKYINTVADSYEGLVKAYEKETPVVPIESRS